MFNLTRKILRFLPTTLVVLSFLPTQAAASGIEIITQPTDFFFSYSEPTQFLAETYQSDGFESDPQLWLYNADTGEEIASNDDYMGLQSKIDLEVPAGNYRLRAATCCGDPNGWNQWDTTWNIQYELSYNGIGSSPPTTTLPPYFNAVQNLTATANEDGSVVLNWGAPVVSNYDRIDIYVVSFYDMVDGIQSGGWGVWTDSENMTYTLSTEMFDGTTGYGPVRFAVKAGSDACVGRTDPLGSCLYGPQAYVDATVLDPTPTNTTTTTTTTVPVTEAPTTTSTTTTTTTTTTEVPTTTTEPETTTTEIPTTTEAPFIEPETPVESPETTFTVVTEPEEVFTPEEEITTPETTIDIPVDEPVDTPVDEVVDEPTDNQDLVNNITDENLTAEEIASVVDEALGNAESEEELLSIASDLLDSDLDPEQFDAVIKSIFSQPLSDEGFEELVAQVFDEELSDEEFASVITAILENPLTEEAFNSFIDVLGGDTVTDDQVQDAVDSIIENGIDETQALSISTSAEVLSSITGDQASEIFAEVAVGDLTDEQGQEIVNAVQDAPEEVRSSFEAEINVFDGAFDNYAPIGSEISVAERRVVVAVGAVLASAMPLPQSTRTESSNGRRVK